MDMMKEERNKMEKTRGGERDIGIIMRGEKTEGREVREAGLQREHSTRMVTKTTD
jgi:hypothetical protein